MTSFSASYLKIRTLASGNTLKVPVFHFTGSPGKKVYIQGNIHGPEVAGIAACYRLIELLKKEIMINGQITIIPSINPVGLDLKINGLQVGYADPNEFSVGNFNRIYQMLVTEKPPSPESEGPQKLVLDEFVTSHLQSDMETIEADFKAGLKTAIADIRAKKSHNRLRFGQQLALTIQDIVHDYDYLIDLHTDAIAVYYGYAFPESLDAFRTFDIPYLIRLSADDFDGVLDEAFLIPWIKLQRAFKKAGRDIPWQDFKKDGITLELGNADYVNLEDADRDAHRLINYLRYRGVLNGDPTLPCSPIFHTTFDHRDNYHAPIGGLVFWHKKPGDQITAGEAVASILPPGMGRGGNTPKLVPVPAAVPGVLINIARSGVAHEGMLLFSILTHLKMLG